MSTPISKAAIPNPALKPFSTLIGEWKTSGTHPQFPDVILEGQTSCKWIEGGGFLLMSSEIFHEKFPSGISIFGSDDALDKYFTLYFDEREVSRKYDVTFQDNVLTWQRNAPGFSQRYTFIFSDDGNTIISKGELSTDDTIWEKDLDFTYARIGS